MSRTPQNRFPALLLAVIFLLSTAGDAFGLAPCPHHELAAAAHQEAAAPHHGHAGGHEAEHHAASPPDAPEDHSGACTCSGACAAGTGAALPPAVVSALWKGLAASAPVAPAPVPVFHPQHPPYFLPYGLAPPALG